MKIYRIFKSRLTMKAKRHLFEDKIEGKGVFLYTDCYDQEWMANYPFWPWSFRTRRLSDEDCRLEELSDSVRRGQTVSFTEAIEVIEYQNMKKTKQK
jgi:hypothetical protein